VWKSESLPAVRFCMVCDSSLAKLTHSLFYPANTRSPACENFFSLFFDLFGLEGSFQGWWQAYYDYPAACSALNFAAVVHRARLANNTQELNKPSTWKEKVSAIQHLNHMFQAKMDARAVESVLLVMVTLFSAEVDPEASDVTYHGPPLAFVPLMTPPEEVAVVGHSPFPEAHVKAAAVLVQRNGGLHTLSSITGLPILIA